MIASFSLLLMLLMLGHISFSQTMRSSKLTYSAIAFYLRVIFIALVLLFYLLEIINSSIILIRDSMDVWMLNSISDVLQNLTNRLWLNNSMLSMDKILYDQISNQTTGKKGISKFKCHHQINITNLLNLWLQTISWSFLC